MSFEERLRAIKDAAAADQEKAERLASEHTTRDNAQHLAAVALQSDWQRVSGALLESGEAHDVLVATPKGIKIASGIPWREPSKFLTPFHKAYERSEIAAATLRKKQTEAIGDNFQPAWHMGSAIVFEGLFDGAQEYNHLRLSIGADATVYTGLGYPGNIILGTNIELPYSQPYYQLNGCLELGQHERDAIEQGLATLAHNHGLPV